MSDGAGPVKISRARPKTCNLPPAEKKRAGYFRRQMPKTQPPFVVIADVAITPVACCVLHGVPLLIAGAGMTNGAFRQV